MYHYSDRRSDLDLEWPWHNIKSCGTLLLLQETTHTPKNSENPGMTILFCRLKIHLEDLCRSEASFCSHDVLFDGVPVVRQDSSDVGRFLHSFSLELDKVSVFSTASMPLIYAFVSRGTTVLADYTSYTGVRMSLLSLVSVLSRACERALKL